MSYSVADSPPQLLAVCCPQELFHELVYDGINTDVMHASRTQVCSIASNDQIKCNGAAQLGLLRRIWASAEELEGLTFDISFSPKVHHVNAFLPHLHCRISVMISFNASGLVRFGSSSVRTSWREASISRWVDCRSREYSEPCSPSVATKVATVTIIRRAAACSFVEILQGWSI